MEKHSLPSAGRGSSRRRAFTLIELLVVVAILGLLISLLMPMLGRARDMARQAKCMANQRNIVNALQSYRAEHRYFPYNYAWWYGSYGGANERWAFGCISPYLAGGPADQVDLRGKDEGEFPPDYTCPSADLEKVYLFNPTDKYHACYWTNPCIRINRGFGGLYGGLFDVHGNKEPGGNPRPPGWDHDSGGLARIFGNLCGGVHWRSVYNPTLTSLPLPEKTMFTGDTNDVLEPGPYGADPGEWKLTPGWGYLHGSLGFRHMDQNMVVSYVDGHVRPFARSELDNYTKWHNGDSTGDLLIRFTDNYSCGGSRIHKLPNPVVE